MAYENRYQKVYEAGVERWGYSPEDKELVRTLTSWVEENQLKGKQIIEFACGEGAAGMILSKLGCIYHGVDIAPSAVEKSKITLKNYPKATVSLLNMVNQQVSETYDAALDVMGFHMLVTDFDRANYLKNVYACLKSGAPMLFFRESYRLDAYEGRVDSFDDWLSITDDDYEKPQQRFAKNGNNDIEVFIPLIPARAKTQEGYICEMTKIGFDVDLFQEIKVSKSIINSASIYVHKP
jgi:Ribosomal protein L11 methylase